MRVCVEPRKLFREQETVGEFATGERLLSTYPKRAQTCPNQEVDMVWDSRDVA